MAAGELAGEGGRRRRAERPLVRVATPDEVAAAILYLALPGAELASGALLELYGASHCVCEPERPNAAKERRRLGLPLFC